MSKAVRASAVLAIGLWVSAVAFGQSQRPGPRESAGKARAGSRLPGSRVLKPLLAATVDPHQFGTSDHTITVLSAMQFRPLCGGFRDAATLSRYCCVQFDHCGSGTHYYTTLNLPAGSVIDFIGVNTATTVDAAMGFTLHFRDHLGGKAELASLSFPAHGFGTDYAGPLGILIPANVDRVFVLDIEQAPALEDDQFFGYVEIWWRRVVSDPPATPTFGDVPSSHPFYQFVEALAKSGITGGCGGGNFCADAPLTRGQMAVFLSKALGLHWPK